MEEKIYTATVSQLNKYIKQFMDKTPILNNIWIKGEISNFKLHYSGHCYLTLKDDGGVLKAVMFKGAALKLNFTPENGMKVLARGRIGVYERDGAYQLYIEEMQPDGLGALHIAYEQLKAKLADEGLFDEKYKKPLPKFPKTVGVVTATTGAAVRDIINVISRRYPYAKILIYPSLVQGDGASENICEAIKYFNDTASADVLIVGRGGGSIEDLWAFNEEATARAIFESDIPIVSAVGHETDFTIADFVADLRAPTPSAAAEVVVPSIYELKQRIDSLESRIIFAMGNNIKNLRNKLKAIALKSPKAKLDDLRMRTDHSIKLLEQNMSIITSKKREQLSVLAGKLQAMSPLSVLNRGYSIAKINDKVIKSTTDVSKDDEFELILTDGSINCRVV